MNVTKEFVFITNTEYTRRISTAYDMGYRQGRSDTITKMTNLVTIAYNGKPNTNVPPTDELAWARPNKTKATKANKKPNRVKVKK